MKQVTDFELQKEMADLRKAHSHLFLKWQIRCVMDNEILYGTEICFK
jgi:hypothetical protein